MISMLFYTLFGMTGCQTSNIATTEKQKHMSIVYVNTNGVVVDERVEDRSWVDIELGFIQGTEDRPAELGNTPDWSGHGAIHIRGNSSAHYDKKQYTIETRSEEGDDIDVAPFGMPEEEDWILHAPYSDKTLMRNHLMYTWSRAIGRYASRTHFVELYMEDGGDELGPEDYRGVYVFMEKPKRDKHRINVNKMDSSDTTAPEITGGYVLKRDWFEANPIETELFEDQLLLEYPKQENVTDTQVDYITEYLNQFEQSLVNEEMQPSEFADLDSFADYLLLIELSRNVDGYVLSTFMHKPRDGLLTMGPIWDFNGSLGNADYFESWEPEGWHYENPEFPADNPNGFRWYEELLKDPSFVQRLSDRWKQHRSSAWSDDALLTNIDETALLLNEAQERNFERWPVLGEHVWPNDFEAVHRHTYEEEIQYLKDWLLMRTAWLDEVLYD